MPVAQETSLDPREAMPTEYMIEYAKSGRAKCRGECLGRTLCWDGTPAGSPRGRPHAVCQVPCVHAGPCNGVIQKAELRFGWLAADSAGNEFFLWKHFRGCLGASYAAQANAARKAVERYGRSAQPRLHNPARTPPGPSRHTCVAAAAAGRGTLQLPAGTQGTQEPCLNGG